MSHDDKGLILQLFPQHKIDFNRLSEVLGEFDRAMVVYPKQTDDPPPLPSVTLSFDFYKDSGVEVSRLLVSKFDLVDGVLVPNQALEPTGLASTPRAGARVAPAKPVAHH